MAFKRTKDLAVKVGTYQAKDGSTKNRYQQVGTLMEDESGSKFLLIDPTFNFAGIQREQGKDRVLVSLFDPKPKGESTDTGKAVSEPENIVWDN